MNRNNKDKKTIEKFADLSGGAIGGIVGGVIGAILLLALVWWLVKRSRTSGGSLAKLDPVRSFADLINSATSPDPFVLTNTL